MRFRYTLAVFAAIMAASAAFSQVLVYEGNIDLQGSPMDQQGNPQWNVGVKAGNTPSIRFYTFSGTNTFNPSAYTVTFHAGPTRDDAGQIQVTGAVQSAYVQFLFPTSALAYAFQNWYSAVKFVSGNTIVSQPEGILSCSGAPEVDGGSLLYTYNVNWLNYLYSHGSNGPTIGDWVTITSTVNSNGQLVLSASGSGVSVGAVTNMIVGLAFTNITAAAGTAETNAYVRNGASLIISNANNITAAAIGTTNDAQTTSINAAHATNATQAATLTAAVTTNAVQDAQILAAADTNASQAVGIAGLGTTNDSQTTSINAAHATNATQITAAQGTNIVDARVPALGYMTGAQSSNSFLDASEVGTAAYSNSGAFVQTGATQAWITAEADTLSAVVARQSVTPESGTDITLRGWILASAGGVALRHVVSPGSFTNFSIIWDAPQLSSSAFAICSPSGVAIRYTNGVFAGDGACLTGLSGSNIQAGTINSGQLAAGVTNATPIAGRGITKSGDTYSLTDVTLDPTVLTNHPTRFFTHVSATNSSGAPTNFAYGVDQNTGGGGGMGVILNTNGAFYVATTNLGITGAGSVSVTAAEVNGTNTITITGAAGAVPLDSPGRAASNLVNMAEQRLVIWSNAVDWAEAYSGAPGEWWRVYWSNAVPTTNRTILRP